MSFTSKLAKHNIIGQILKILRCLNIVSRMLSLPKIILHELQCFQKLLKPSLQLLRSKIDENQLNLKWKLREKYVKINISL
jgi:hypothetical protein